MAWLLAVALVSGDGPIVKGAVRFDGAPVSWAFVYVKKASVALKPVNMGQVVTLRSEEKGFAPRVLGVQVGQPLIAEFNVDHAHLPHWFPRVNPPGF